MMRSRLAPEIAINAGNRRGAVLLWFIIALPVLLTLLCVLLEVANLYLARAELTNALESGALAAVKAWGDNGGGDTFIPRTIGNAFSNANTINGVPVNLQDIDVNLNYRINPCNQNDTADGVLVFGAIVEDTPDFVFNCCELPSCGIGTVWLDVSAQSALGGSDNEWGISFQPNTFPYPNGTPPDLRITRVVYVLPEVCQVAQGGGFKNVFPRFDFSSDPTTVSSAIVDNDPNVFVQDLCNQTPEKSAQSDVFGIDPNQVKFFVDLDLNADLCDPNNGTDRTGQTHPTLTRSLAVQFPDAPGILNGFDVEDHIRFGAKVTNEGGMGGNANVGGDEIGECMTEVTICFNDGTSCTATFFDNDERSNACFPASPFGGNTKCAGLAPWGNNTNPPQGIAENHGLIVHPSGVPDLPCPPASGVNNNGQSLASVVAGDCNGGGTGFAFAVRAQATFPVQSICCQICDIPVGPFFVTAKADALYDCVTRTPRLYHLKPENYICMPPPPP